MKCVKLVIARLIGQYPAPPDSEMEEDAEETQEDGAKEEQEQEEKKKGKMKRTRGR